MTETCDRCHREKWQSTGGMGGGLMPDDLAICTGGQTCVIFGEGFKRGIIRGVEIAKENASIDAQFCNDGDGHYDDMSEIDWSDVDAAAKKEVGDGM